jgi:hypothetical protein
MAGQVVTPPLNFLMLLCLSETALGTIFLTPYVGERDIRAARSDRSWGTYVAVDHRALPLAS